MKRSESQGTRANGKRSAGRLNSKLEKNLLTYAAAASAAGVGMFAGAQSAEARIVYTPTNTVIAPAVALDLNHDGIMDFNLVQWGAASVGGSFRISYLQVCHVPLLTFSHQCISSTFDPNAQNVVREGASGALALPFGVPIGPGQSFKGVGVAVLMGARIFYSAYWNTVQKWEGPWVNGGTGVTNRYLGLKFQIDGKWHFGWARLTFVTTPKNGFSATLTGYAYETIPNTRIRAGQTTGTAEVSMNVIDAILPAKEEDGPSLGSLALGAPGLSIWRREEDSLN